MSSKTRRVFLAISLLFAYYSIVFSKQSKSELSGPEHLDSAEEEEKTKNTEEMDEKLQSVEFEIHGKVQGVYFRKYTQQQAAKLGLRGWCQNTARGTVTGKLEGNEEQISQMKEWLRTVGSPSSRIDKAEFKNEQKIHSYSHSSFTIKR